jgi:hypothetical protein
MRFFSTLLGAIALPAAALAQQPAATHPPVTYRVGLARAPLFRRLADTLRPANVFAPSQTALSVVSEVSPRWAVAEREGFRYFVPTAALVNYDPADADLPPLSATTHRISYEGVVQVPGASQTDLFARARTWVGQAYDQQNAQVTRADEATGEIQLQGARLAQVYQDFQGVPRATYAGVVRHSFTIYVKDGRYKYILTDFVHDAQRAPALHSGGALEQKRATLFGYGGIGSYQTWTELKTDALRDARHLLAGLEAAMTLQKTKTRRSASDF